MALEQETLSALQNASKILSELVIRTGANPIYANYTAVAASSTAHVLGESGAKGDFLAAVLVIPASTSPGSVAILDNATSQSIFAGGASSVPDLKPFLVPLGIKSVNGAWKITTGSGVSVIAMGTFR